ncbi:hypothetical protein [Streptomyces stelliscabiei]|uniref:hypothetical protein n=1 Tax=Streptomyces stelliscabiei TaxID=146820 RepID=UPI0029ADDB52|nr:hypothetical protein [Streptomyces stelliscabiei]MDX2549493.1 hypothetical protein [Streptomyces stelliscabiei]MDX2611515.1 hypothetical protein [Streptomyces stelliscabiei]MDX2634389.1 hypothetical protein [Streptomyces stelliscabiei]MDX2659335.1 hypothetical protein [Streptomyces stelliscabiei]MDX2710981.1 hypothetical protein [Streptomyces stelliscabiei]
MRRRLVTALSAAIAAVVLPLTTASPAAASPPTTSCQIEHEASIIFWGVACTQPGEPVIGAFATWRNAPVTFTSGSTGDTTVSAANYLTMTPNTEGGLFANYVQVGLYAEKTGASTSTYGPRWTELGDSGGRTEAITVGTNPSTPDGMNHTYMVLRQDNTDQWDVLYDFNWVGSTTDQLAVPRGNANRIDIGLEVMGPQYLTVPQIANRVQYMAENKTWYRAATANTAQVASLGLCGQGSTAPYCFDMQLTDNTTFTQLAVAKPGPATLQSADGSAGLKQGVPSGQSSSAETTPLATHGTYNGVDQTALAACMAQDPDNCLTTVPGLAQCVQTVQRCNAAALAAKDTDAARTSASSASGATREQILARAAASFDVPTQELDITSADSTATSFSTAGSGATDAVWTVDSSSSTHGLEQRGRLFHGFRATYSAVTGRLLDACWGTMCS